MCCSCCTLGQLSPQVSRSRGLPAALPAAGGSRRAQEGPQALRPRRCSRYRGGWAPRCGLHRNREPRQLETRQNAGTAVLLGKHCCCWFCCKAARLLCCAKAACTLVAAPCPLDQTSLPLGLLPSRPQRRRSRCSSQRRQRRPQGPPPGQLAAVALPLPPPKLRSPPSSAPQRPRRLGC